MAFLKALWTFLNSPVGITVIGSIVAYALSKLYTAKPAWQKYEGAIISAIKYAEKAIPDDAENKSLKRLDEALDYVLEVFEKVNERNATPQETAALTEGIRIVHDELEAEGTI